jgi:hypothetical protein
MQGSNQGWHPCRAPAVERELCFFHAHPEKTAELGREGGRKNRHWTSTDSEVSPRSLKSFEEELSTWTKSSGLKAVAVFGEGDAFRTELSLLAHEIEEQEHEIHVPETPCVGS